MFRELRTGRKDLRRGLVHGSCLEGGETERNVMKTGIYKMGVTSKMARGWAERDGSATVLVPKIDLVEKGVAQRRGTAGGRCGSDVA